MSWLLDAEVLSQPLIEALHGRILGFNVSVAHVWAEQQHKLEEIGQPTSVEDSRIAAIAIRHNLTVATGKLYRLKRRRQAHIFSRPWLSRRTGLRHLPPGRHPWVIPVSAALPQNRAKALNGYLLI